MMPQTMAASVKTAAISGVRAWLIYGIAETGFAVLLWPFRLDEHIEPNWMLTVFVMLVYAALGLLLGGSVGIVVHRLRTGNSEVDGELLDSAAKLSLVLVVFVNYLKSVSWTPAFLVLGAAIFAALIATIFSPAGVQSRLRFATNLWPLMISIFGLNWVSTRLMGASGPVPRFLVGLVFICIVFAISFVIHRRRAGTPDPPVRAATRLPALAGTAAIVVGIAYFMNSEPAFRGPVSAAGEHAKARPNILLITMDTVRADHLSLYGYSAETTPNLRALAREATVYRRAESASDLTLSTHASLFTGLYPRVHGAHYAPPKYKWGRPLDAKFRTLAEVLADNGYATLAVIANYGYLAHSFSIDRGFHYYDGRKGNYFLQRMDGLDHTLRERVRSTIARFAPEYLTGIRYRRAEDINHQALTTLDQVRSTERPFFLFLNYMDAHAPYLPPPPFRDRFPGRDERLNQDWFLTTREKVMVRGLSITPHQRQHLISQYDGGIAYIDYAIGELIKQLKAEGLYENTMLIITADHGEAFGERNLLEHGVSVYNDQVNVPLIIKYPRTSSGSVDNALVSSVDIMPTVLDVAGIRPLEGLQGRTLLHTNNEPRVIISESFPWPHFDAQTARFRRVETAAFRDAYKLIYSDSGKVELFNVVTDPLEQNNLYARNEEVGRELLERVRDWRRTSARPTAPRKVDAHTLEQLKSLGYVQ